MSLIDFLCENLSIEGVDRDPTDREIKAAQSFLALPKINTQAVSLLQAVYTPGFPLRSSKGMDVCVGNHCAPLGGIAITGAFGNLIWRISQGADPWLAHAEFERLHPFLDGNGRTGRIVWAWNMQRVMIDPFARSFLKQWYFWSLSRMDKV